MVADLGGYTTDFAMVGFDLDNVAFQSNGRHDGKRLLGSYSEPIGVHELDNEVREYLPIRTARSGSDDRLATSVFFAYD